jgi:hypothetical protein
MVEAMESPELQLHQLQQHPEVEEVVEVEAQVVEVEVEEAVDQAILGHQCPLLGIIEQELQEELLEALVGVEEVVEEVVGEVGEEVEDLHQEDLQGREDLEAVAHHQVENTQMVNSGLVTC